MQIKTNKNIKIKARITFKYQTENQAKIALNSLKPDNMDFIYSYIHYKCLICNLKGDNIRTILATADDLLFCEMMVEKITTLTEE